MKVTIEEIIEYFELDEVNANKFKDVDSLKKTKEFEVIPVPFGDKTFIINSDGFHCSHNMYYIIKREKKLNELGI